MNSTRIRATAVLAAALAVAFACSNTYLFDERRDDALPNDRALRFEGEFCTPSTNEVRRPIKIAIAMDASQSMQVSDPFGARAQAVVDLINSLPAEPEVYISVMLFAGFTTTYLTRDAFGNNGFQQVTGMTPAERINLQQQILVFTNPVGQPNRDSTSFVQPLADVYALISTDISRARANNEGAARYSVIFLTDGRPTICQDQQLICNGSPPVQRIRDLRELADDIRVHFVHVFQPQSPVSSICDLDGGTGQFNFGGCTIYCQTGVAPIPCPNLIINQNVDRLQRMAAAGGGLFRDFRNNEPITFLNFDLGQVRRTFELKEFVVSNFSAPVGSPQDVADSDGDKLTDEREQQIGTDPLARDTDGDGFSDGVEVKFAPAFNPTQVMLPDGGGVDPGCPPTLRGVDADCDGLLDCDEQLVGTNARRMDSDDDGAPDAIEWLGGTQGSSPDLEQDPDTDGLSNRNEVRMHMDPVTVDNARLSIDGYRYRIVANGGPDAEGRQCYRFEVDNVALAPTLADFRDGGTGRAAGYNDIMLSVAMVPSEEPDGRTRMTAFRVTNPRYPIGGIKSPPDGVIRVVPGNFVEGCGPVP